MVRPLCASYRCRCWRSCCSGSGGSSRNRRDAPACTPSGGCCGTALSAVLRGGGVYMLAKCSELGSSAVGRPCGGVARGHGALLVSSYWLRSVLSGTMLHAVTTACQSPYSTTRFCPAGARLSARARMAYCHVGGRLPVARRAAVWGLRGRGTVIVSPSAIRRAISNTALSALVSSSAIRRAVRALTPVAPDAWRESPVSAHPVRRARSCVLSPSRWRRTRNSAGVIRWEAGVVTALLCAIADPTVSTPGQL